MTNDSMYHAARRGDLSAVRSFAYRQPESVNEHDPDWGTTPLHWAAKAGNLELAMFLLDAGADIDAVDTTNRTPLQWVLQADTSSYKNARPIIHLLLSRNATHTFETAIRRGVPEHVTAWLDRGTPIDVALADGSSALAMAAQHAAAEVVQLLLDSGAPPDGEAFDETSPLLRAIEANRPEILELLLRSGANPELGGRCNHLPLDYVVYKGQIRKEAIVELGDLLLDHNARITPQLAAILDSENFLDQALAAGWDINRRDHRGSTALSIAAQTDKVSITGTLIDRGADPDVADDFGHTPLHIVARFPFMRSSEPRTEIAKLLIKAGADVNAIDTRGRTPLHAALETLRSMGVNVEVVRMLVDAGADPQARDDEGVPPFEADQAGRMDLHGHSRAEMDEAAQRMRTAVATVKEILRLT